ncbi:hypothetical protein [Methylobacterium radiodurans]|uniref:Uncharacterized protein n=1 Tax=Methylobacterium radiodurans TaxID=2202828 RepID=A0A2U8VX46_9HYPH|nr:hypothetical protein [Methylobacterium radiodurans]AWN37716.1 hypothetical protein DK427_19925 [Methylobacterium radiodurans]
MVPAAFSIVITGPSYACRVTGGTEGEAADTAERILRHLQQEKPVRPLHVLIECEDLAAGERLAVYLADVTVEPGLG